MSFNYPLVTDGEGRKKIMTQGFFSKITVLSNSKKTHLKLFSTIGCTVSINNLFISRVEGSDSNSEYEYEYVYEQRR
jgi:hypothetical protein